jgi:hypothetical protein
LKCKDEFQINQFRVADGNQTLRCADVSLIDTQRFDNSQRFLLFSFRPPGFETKHIEMTIKNISIKSTVNNAYQALRDIDVDKTTRR